MVSKSLLLLGPLFFVVNNDHWIPMTAMGLLSNIFAQFCNCFYFVFYDLSLSSAASETCFIVRSRRGWMKAVLDAGRYVRVFDSGRSGRSAPSDMQSHGCICGEAFDCMHLGPFNMRSTSVRSTWPIPYSVLRTHCLQANEDF